MTTYSEKNSIHLLTSSSDADGDTILVRRINGSVISSWPHSVSLPVGSVTITESGEVNYDDGGSTSGHPGNGQSAANGSLTFRLWDGTDESPTYTATIQLDTPFVNTAPTGQNQTLVFEV